MLTPRSNSLIFTSNTYQLIQMMRSISKYLLVLTLIVMMGIQTTELLANDTIQKSGTHSMTKADFISKVFDYPNNPTTWNYLGDKPAIIDFYADWCGPCRRVAPILNELADVYKDEIYIYKVDTEKEQELAAIFGIKSLPSFLIIPMKGKPMMHSGVARTDEETKQMFIKIIEEQLLTKEQKIEE